MAELWQEPIESYSEFQSKQEAQAARAQEAVYSYREAGQQYGGRSLHVPDHQWARAHFQYPRREPTRSYNRSSRRRREASGYRPSYGGYQPPEPLYASTQDATRAQWWRLYFGAVGEALYSFFHAK